MTTKGRRGGAAKTPARLKLLEGRSPGRDSGGRPVKQPPSFVRLPPDPPEWLPDEARAEWERVVPELQRLELLKPLDRASLTAYCLAWERLVRAQRLLARGLLHTNSQGKVRHPAVAILEAASKDLRAWAQQFGLSPAAEAALTAPSAEADGAAENPFAGAGS